MLPHFDANIPAQHGFALLLCLCRICVLVCHISICMGEPKMVSVFYCLYTLSLKCPSQFGQFYTY